MRGACGRAKYDFDFKKFIFIFGFRCVSFIHSFICLFVCLFIPTFIRPFIRKNEREGESEMKAPMTSYVPYIILCKNKR